MAPGLYEATNALVEQRLKEASRVDQVINVPDWVEDVVQALADMIVNGSSDAEREKLTDYATIRLRQAVMEKASQFGKL